MQKEFPKRPEVTAMLLQVAENSDPEKSRAVLKEIAASDDAADEIKDAAAEMGKELERVGEPFAVWNLPPWTVVRLDLDKMQRQSGAGGFLGHLVSSRCVEMPPVVKDAYDKSMPRDLKLPGSIWTGQGELHQFIWPNKKWNGRSFSTPNSRDTKYAGGIRGSRLFPRCGWWIKKACCATSTRSSIFTNKVARLLGE